jgi:hypothetical protein
MPKRLIAFLLLALKSIALDLVGKEHFTSTSSATICVLLEIDTKKSVSVLGDKQWMLSV